MPLLGGLALFFFVAIIVELILFVLRMLAVLVFVAAVAGSAVFVVYLAYVVLEKTSGTWKPLLKWMWKKSKAASDHLGSHVRAKFRSTPETTSRAFAAASTRWRRLRSSTRDRFETVRRACIGTGRRRVAMLARKRRQCLARLRGRSLPPPERLRGNE